MKSFHVFCEVYGTNLFVIIGGTYDEVVALMKRRFKIDPREHFDGNDPTGGCHLHFDKWPYQVIWIAGANKKHGRIELAAKISHEVYHHVLRLCVAKGVPTYPMIDNLVMDEAGAYLMEFYMREILKRL